MPIYGGLELIYISLCFVHMCYAGQSEAGSRWLSRSLSRCPKVRQDTTGERLGRELTVFIRSCQRLTAAS